MAHAEIDRLDPGERQDLIEPVLDADAGVAPTAEWHGRKTGLDVVDPDVAGLDPVREPKGAIDVLVQIAAVNPYGPSFARATASASVRTSSPPAPGRTPPRRPAPCPASPGRRPSADEERARERRILGDDAPARTRAPAPTARSTMVEAPVARRSRDHRAHLGRQGLSASDPDRCRPVGTRSSTSSAIDRGSRAGSSIRNSGPGPGCSSCPGRSRRHLVEVDVRIDHDRVLAAQLEGDRLHVAASAAAAWIRSAVAVLPVNDRRRIDGWRTSAAPVAGPPMTT